MRKILIFTFIMCAIHLYGLDKRDVIGLWSAGNNDFRSTLIMQDFDEYTPVYKCMYIEYYPVLPGCDKTPKLMKTGYFEIVGLTVKIHWTCVVYYSGEDIHFLINKLTDLDEILYFSWRVITIQGLKTVKIEELRSPELFIRSD